MTAEEDIPEIRVEAIPPPTSAKDQAWFRAVDIVADYIRGELEEETELTEQQRVGISLLEGIAYHPFRDFPDIQSKALQNYIKRWDRRGKSVNRGSRKEAVQMVTGMFTGLRDRWHYDDEDEPRTLLDKLRE